MRITAVIAIATVLILGGLTTVWSLRPSGDLGLKREELLRAELRVARGNGTLADGDAALLRMLDEREARRRIDALYGN